MRHAEIARKSDCHEVARALDAGAERRRAGEFAAVVLGPPGLLPGALVDGDGSVEHHRRGRIAVVEGGGIDERLERRAGLAAGLGRAIELAFCEAETAHKRPHAAGVGVHDHDGTIHLGLLHERPGAFLLVVRRHIDHIARFEQIGDIAAPRACPFDCIIAEHDRFARFLKLAVLDTARPQADEGLAARDLEHHRKPPGQYVARHRHLGQRLAPIATDVDAGDRPTPAMAAVVPDEAIDECLLGEALQLGIECRAHRQAAAIKFFLTIPFEQLATHLFGEELGGEDACTEWARVDVKR